MQPSTPSSFMTFSSTYKMPLYPFAVLSHAHLQPQETTDTLFISIDLLFLEILCNWNCTICSLLCLFFFPFSTMHLRFIHVEISVVCFFCIAEQHSIVQIYYIYFIYAPVNEYLNYFQFLLIMNNVASNTPMYVFRQTYTFNSLHRYLGVKLMDDFLSIGTGLTF